MALQWKDDHTDQLCEAFLTLKNKDEVYDFLEDIAAVSEIRAFSQRLQVAKLLMQGDSYPKISKTTGASTATISRVRKTVDYGRDALKQAFERMKEAGEE